MTPSFFIYLFFLLASRSTSLQRTPRSLNEHNGLLQTVTSWTTNKFSPNKFGIPSTACSSELMSSGSSAIVFAMSPATTSFLCDAKQKHDKRGGKVLGPHCAQFLSKIGLLKGQSTEYSFETDDHQCFRSNETVINLN